MAKILSYEQYCQCFGPISREKYEEIHGKPLRLEDIQEGDELIFVYYDDIVELDKETLERLPTIIRGTILSKSEE